ncbi:MAG: flagellar filament capping protein FliD [Sarcina sp.]
MRIGGLASGLDTDTMVKQMMMPHKMKVDSVKQDKLVLEYKQQLYRDINKDMRDLYTKYFDVGSTANKGTNLILSSNYQTVSFESSDKGVVTAQGLAGAKTGKYSVEVKNLAEPSSMTLSKEAFSRMKPEEEFELTLGKGKTIKVKLTKDMFEMDGETPKDIKMDKVSNAINESIKAYNKDSKNKEKIDVKVEFSELGNNIKISGSTTGEGNNIELGVGGLKSKVGVDKKDATDATVILSDAYGNKKEVKKPSNQFTIDNVQYTLNGVSEAGKSTTLTGSHDVDDLVNNISDFVKDYNALIDKINGKLGEKRDRSYKPLTDEQKKEMSEDEIKLWELKCKQGLLRGDSILESSLNKLLGTISSTEEGKQLSSIGLSPFSDYKTGKGKIELDEEKLREALTTNGDETRKMLTGTFNKMKDVIYDTAVKSDSLLNKKAGYEGGVSAYNNDLTKKMDEKQKMIGNLNRSLAKKENQYYADFARLEVAMNKANAMMSQFIGMSGM